jgi:hypothetical protein
MPLEEAVAQKMLALKDTIWYLLMATVFKTNRNAGVLKNNIER